jgi:hypothetical protein
MNYILNFLNKKIKHSKIYNFYKNILNKMNDQTYIKKSTTIIKPRQFLFLFTKIIKWYKPSFVSFIKII